MVLDVIVIVAPKIVGKTCFFHIHGWYVWVLHCIHPPCKKKKTKSSGKLSPQGQKKQRTRDSKNRWICNGYNFCNCARFGGAQNPQQDCKKTPQLGIIERKIVRYVLSQNKIPNKHLQLLFCNSALLSLQGRSWYFVGSLSTINENCAWSKRLAAWNIFLGCVFCFFLHLLCFLGLCSFCSFCGFLWLPAFELLCGFCGFCVFFRLCSLSFFGYCNMWAGLVFLLQFFCVTFKGLDTSLGSDGCCLAALLLGGWWLVFLDLMFSRSTHNFSVILLRG